jgi:hypothetical protein
MKMTSKNMIQSRGQGTRCGDVAHQKNGKKEVPAEEKLTQPTKTVRYDKMLVTGVIDLLFSWWWRLPSWLTMLTLSCYHMIDSVLLF